MCSRRSGSRLQQAGDIWERLGGRQKMVIVGKYAGIGALLGVAFVAGKIGDKGPGAGCDGPVAKIARDFRPRLNAAEPVTVIDFKAGLEDLARGNIATLDWIVVVVDPSTAAVQVAAHIRDTEREVKAGVPPATSHLEFPDLIEWAKKLYCGARIQDVLVVLNRIQDAETAAYLRRRLAAHALEPVTAIREDPALALTWLKGEPLAETAAQSKLSALVEALEKAAAAEAVA